MMYWLQSLLALFVLCQLAQCAETEDELKKKFKLPGTVEPEAYRLNLVLDKDVFTPKSEKENKYTGEVAIVLKVIEDNVSQIVLHARKVSISKKDVKLSYSADTNASFKLNVSEVALETDQVIITVDPKLNKNGTYQLTIPFAGDLELKEMDGFYKSSYKNKDDKEEFLATTQFESTSARRAFPCFDEPALKATFELTITYPDGYNALSNTPQDGAPVKVKDKDGKDSLEKAKFKPTPKMSTYLLAFVVSKFKCTPGNKTELVKIPNEVCAREGEENTIKLANTVPANILPIMKDFTGFDYETSGIGKLSQVAIPDFAAGAMENWGLLTFREADLLYDENESSESYKARIVTVITHEIAHQWFGDLVTLKWWSDIFLNEGFATYFEYHAANQVKEYKDWQLDKRFVTEELHAALADDVDAEHQPLHHNVYKPADISSRFDSISYNKGGSVIRMLQHVVGLENFKKGLGYYINQHKNSNTEPVHLWESFDKDEVKVPNLPTDKKIVDIMDEWTNKAGYPLVKVELNANGKNVSLSQVKFVVGSKMEDSSWWVPISYVSSGNPNASTNTQPKQWLGKDKITFALPDKSDWLILNNQQSGYYRVDYDNTLWKKITDFLKSDKLDSIDVLNRAQITDDLFNLAKAGVRSYADTLNFLEYLKNDDSYYTWYAASSGFNFLLNRATDDKILGALEKFISSHMDKLIKNALKELDGDLNGKKLPDLLNLNLALDWACRLNNDGCVKYATEELQKYINDTKTKPNRNLRNVVYCNGLRYSKNIEAEWNFLWGEMQKTSLSTEQVTILRALGCANDKKVITDYLAKAIAKDSPIRIQDASYAFSSSYQSNRENIDVVLDFIKTNSKAIIERFGSNKNLISYIKGIGDRLYNQAQISKLNSMTTDDSGVKDAITKAVAKANKNLEAAETLKKDLLKYFKLDGNTANMNIVHYTALVPTIILLIAMYFH